MKIMTTSIFALVLCTVACSGTTASRPANDENAETSSSDQLPPIIAGYSPDSAYNNIARQLDFGPRVPGSPSHTACGNWIEQKLRDYGSDVVVQEKVLTAFDGTPLPAKNILGRFAPEASDRTLLVAHWDTRPWADEDPDPENRDKPVPGANDGASGVGVLLEIARVISENGTNKGIDILLVDAEDYGTEGDDMSWALGARLFAQNPPIPGYRPSRVILLDMVGGKGTTFRREYFSHANAAPLLNDVWAAAARAGHDNLFINEPGGAITDDHIEFLRVGIPAIDIVAFSDTGFPDTWHTVADDLDHIDPAALNAVGRTLLTYLFGN